VITALGVADEVKVAATGVAMSVQDPGQPAGVDEHRRGSDERV